MNNTIAAVVVTYNRKDLLIECLESIRNQIKMPDAIYIIDNHSTDGTPNLLKDSGYISQLPNSESIINQVIEFKITSLFNPKFIIQIIYVRKCLNDGGAGGFYEGMKLAFDAGYKWIWMMDDDGIPDSHQLNNLISYSTKSRLKYLNALVIDKNNTQNLAFNLKSYCKLDEIKEKEFIINFISAFNGTLISRDIISNIGMIKKEMFIWGDEREYTNRVKRNGYQIGTVISAIHYHPKIKGTKENILPFNIGPKITIKPANMAHIYFRNNAYNNKTYGTWKVVIVEFLLYGIYFLSRLRIRSFMKFMLYYNRGLINKFN